MIDPSRLRAQAAQCRRAAGIATEGGQAADRQLIALARKLERTADTIERMTRTADGPAAQIPSGSDSVRS